MLCPGKALVHCKAWKNASRHDKEAKSLLPAEKSPKWGLANMCMATIEFTESLAE